MAGSTWILVDAVRIRLSACALLSLGFWDDVRPWSGGCALRWFNGWDGIAY
jgi:hypothetical protein